MKRHDEERLTNFEWSQRVHRMNKGEIYEKGEETIQASTHVHNLVLQIRIRSYSWPRQRVSSDWFYRFYRSSNCIRRIYLETKKKPSPFWLNVIATQENYSADVWRRKHNVNRQPHRVMSRSNWRTAESICTTTNILVRVVRSHRLVVALAFLFVMLNECRKTAKSNTVEWIPCECIQTQLQT